MDVVVAGAGPVGLLLAAELAAAGVRTVVLEARAEPSTEPKANGLVGQIVPLLDRRGLYAELAGAPGPPQPHRGWFFFGGLPLDLGLAPDVPVHLLAVPQARIERVLGDRVAALGVEVRRGHALTGLEQHPDRVLADVRGPDGPYRIPAHHLAGTDGAHSLVRKLSGIGFPGLALDRMTTFSAHVTVPDGLLGPDGTLLVPGHDPVRPFLPLRTPHGSLSYAPLPGGPPIVTTAEWDRPPADGPTTLGGLHTSLRRVLGTDLPLGPPDGPGPHLLRRLDGGHVRVADRFRDGRVLLAGDAAHVWAAGGGPGLNTGLQDALNLAWRLAARLRGAPDAVLDGYASERSAVAHRTATYARAQAALIAPGDDVDGLRAIVGELCGEPSVVARLAALIAGPDIRYDAGDGAHPLAGRFCPDRVVHTGDGPVRLAEQARDGRAVLLDPSPDGRVGALADGVPGGPRVVRARPGDAAPPAVLVRPDGYVAWASDHPIPDDDELAALRGVLRADHAPPPAASPPAAPTRVVPARPPRPGPGDADR